MSPSGTWHNISPWFSAAVIKIACLPSSKGSATCTPFMIGMRQHAGSAAVLHDLQPIIVSTRLLVQPLLVCRKLRSADAAFELLESFKSIKSRGAIRKQMMNKMNDILQQFRREIDTTTAIFHTLKVMLQLFV